MYDTPNKTAEDCGFPEPSRLPAKWVSGLKATVTFTAASRIKCESSLKNSFPFYKTYQTCGTHIAVMTSVLSEVHRRYCIHQSMICFQGLKTAQSSVLLTQWTCCVSVEQQHTGVAVPSGGPDETQGTGSPLQNHPPSYCCTECTVNSGSWSLQCLPTAPPDSHPSVCDCSRWLVTSPYKEPRKKKRIRWVIMSWKTIIRTSVSNTLIAQLSVHGSARDHQLSTLWVLPHKKKRADHNRI